MSGTNLLVSLSGLETAAICPGSMALAADGHVSAPADEGSAGHEYVQVLVERGRGAAEEAAGGIAERWGVEDVDAWFGRMRAFDPPIPPGAISEQPLALLEDGSVVPVEGGRGRYEAPEGTLVAGTLDLAWSEPHRLRLYEPIGSAPLYVETPAASMLWVADLKFGMADFVPPVRRNLQVRVGALLAARWTGARAVVPAVIFPGRGAGRWDVPLDAQGQAVPLGEEDLRDIEQDVRRIVSRGRRALAMVRGGRRPELVTGAHCGYCRCRASCPAHVEEVRALVGSGPAQDLVVAPLDHAQAVVAAELLGRWDSYKRVLRAALETFVTENPGVALRLANGKEWGPQETSRDVFDTRVTYDELVDALSPLVGEQRAAEIADDAFRASKESLKGALEKGRSEAGLGRGLAGALRELLERIEARGGKTSRPRIEWGAHYPREEAPALPEAAE